MILKLIYRILAFIFYHLRINLLFSFIIKDYIEYYVVNSLCILIKDIDYKMVYLTTYSNQSANHFAKIIKKDGFSKYIDVYNDGVTTVFLINKKNENIY